jgi:hypothetical protein
MLHDLDLIVSRGYGIAFDAGKIHGAISLHECLSFLIPEHPGIVGFHKTALPVH